MEMFLRVPEGYNLLLFFVSDLNFRRKLQSVQRAWKESHLWSSKDFSSLELRNMLCISSPYCKPRFTLFRALW